MAHSQFYQDSNHHGNRNHVFKKKKKQLRQKENLLTHRTWVSRTTATRNSQTIRAILLLSRSSVFCVLALFFLIFFIRLQIYPSRYKNHGTSNFRFNVNVFLIHPWISSAWQCLATEGDFLNKWLKKPQLLGMYLCTYVFLTIFCLFIIFWDKKSIVLLGLESPLSCLIVVALYSSKADCGFCKKKGGIIWKDLSCQLNKERLY